MLQNTIDHEENKAAVNSFDLALFSPIHNYQGDGFGTVPSSVLQTLCIYV
jgi:hypothetical protein